MLKKLFKKPNWQHKQAVIRIQAIQEELDPNNAEQQSILREMVDNDADKLVCQSALLKLNDVQLLIEIAKQNNHHLSQFARQQLEKMLLSQDATALTQQQQASILEMLSNAELEKFMLQSNEVQQVMAIYQKLAKPNLAIQLFRQKQDAELQSALLAEINDSKSLEKIVKYAANNDIVTEINQKLEQIQQAELMPQKVQKQAQLLLSKYLALKDQVDYQQVVDKQQEYKQEWQKINEQFAWLDSDSQQQLHEKYQQIVQQIDKIFAVKAEAYQQQLVIEKLNNERIQATADFQQQIDKFTQQLTEAVFQDEVIDNESFLANISQLEKQISSSVLTSEQQQKLLALLQHNRQQLQQLPEIAASVAKATQLIAQFANLPLPENLEQLNERWPQFLNWQKQWQQAYQLAGSVLPKTVVDAYEQIETQWQQGCKSLFSEQKQLFQRTKRKLNDIRRLVNIGKFNACFAIHKKVLNNWPLLSLWQQNKLQNDKNWVDEKIAELSDWEHYVATPKKQALLDEIKTLVVSPLDNPIEQADAIKKARQRWNALGHAEADAQLNQEFNQAIEQAFAPCRQYFAEQEKIRAQHLLVRQQIVTDAKALSAQYDEQPMDWKALEHQLNQLHKRWQQAGEVDRQAYKKVQQAFFEAIKPVKAALNEYHQQNAQQKQLLINQAKLLKQKYFDNGEAVVDDIKALQAKWKTIGFSGHHQENKLWQQFRQQNDEIFAHRAEINHSEQQSNKALQAQLEQQLLDIVGDNSQQASLAELEQKLVAIDELTQSLLAENKLSKAIKAKLQSYKIKVEKQQQNAITEQQKQQWQLLFSVLADCCEQNDKVVDGEDFQQLSPSWQKRIQDLLHMPQAENRLNATIAIEIVANLATPEQDANIKRQVQLDLMQQKLNSGAELNVETLFDTWLQLGKLSKSDLPLLQRIQPAFVH